MSDPASICLLSIFPLGILIAGLYFFYRAKGLLSQATELKEAVARGPVPGALAVLTGKPSSEEPVISYLGEPECIYSRLLLEYLDHGKKRWVPLKTFERRAGFTLSGFSVDPSNAEFDATAKEVFQEAKKPPPPKDGIMGEIGQFGAQMRSARSKVPLTAESAEPYGTAFDAKPFDNRTIETLAQDHDVGILLRQYWHHRKRATIQTIKASDNVVVIGTVDSQGTFIQKGRSRFLISTEAMDRILKQDEGRVWLSALIGFGLVIFSLVTFVLLFF
jgi:hypothetical protein